MRESSDVVERIGIERARARAEAADLRVFLKSEPDEVPPISLRKEDLVLQGKADKYPDLGDGISGLTGAGVDRLIDMLAARLEARTARAATATHLRHAQAMIGAVTTLEAAQAEVQAGAERTELAAEQLRHAVRRLDALIGRMDVETVLGEIFSRFCLGK